MTLSQSSSSSSLYASPIGRFSSGFAMYDLGDVPERYPSSKERDRKTGDSRKHDEELINAYEAEEERIVNVLSKKLEQLREDKIDLENVLEAESESHVNRLSRELGALRRANLELEQRLAERERLHLERDDNRSNSSRDKGKGKGRSESSSSEPDDKPRGKKANSSSNGKYKTSGNAKRPTNGLTRVGSNSRSSTLDGDTTLVALTPITTATLASPSATPLTVSTRNLKQHQQTQGDIANPSPALIFDALRRENEQLRTKLVDMEREYGRVKRLNDVYREELIGLRGKLGLSVDNLIGFTSSDRDPLEHPTHMRSRTGNETHRDSPSPVFVPGTSASTSRNGVAMSYQPRFVHEAAGSSMHANYQHWPLSNGHHLGHGHGSTSSYSNDATGSMSVPIPRPPSQIRHRPLTTAYMGGPFPGVDDDDLEDDMALRRGGTSAHDRGNGGSGGNAENNVISPSPSTPSSVSSASLLYPFSDSSPVTSSVLRNIGSGATGAPGDPASYVSVETDVTSPPSSGSFRMMGMGMMNANMHGMGNGVGMGGMVMGSMGLGAYGVPQRGLSYPSVPPPSLSSSFGSPAMGAVVIGSERGESISPIHSRRGSVAGIASRRGSVNEAGSSTAGRRVVETGSLRRAGSVSIGGRIAETGSLVGNRSRAGSVAVNTAGAGAGPSAESSLTLREAVDEDDGVELTQ
ncbi:hypothetical protein D9613_008682 [Agrocybe pediades]|uniref:Uncharacterized protein n=1 Tax=Agrocybe pediades TaxID=84607 RepID=A0A8H4VNU7_9AGAR|nr:hypothetical protein D9613_008682 [Agrocybe pediades]